MLGNTYEGQTCSVARSLELIGERWTILIVRDVFRGIRRFDDLQRSLGVARNVLQSRLARLVEHGILERSAYQERPQRFEYRLTEAGVDLWPVVVALLQWGDKHAAPDGPPVVLEHRDCGGELDGRRICKKCGEPLEARDVRLRPGPALGADAPVEPALAS